MDLDGLVEGFIWILFKGLKRYTIACLRKRIYNLVIDLHMHLQILDKSCMLHGHASMYNVMTDFTSKSRRHEKSDVMKPYGCFQK